VHTYLLNSGWAASLPSDLHRAASTGDFDPIAGQLARVVGYPQDDTSRLVMSWSIRCSESWARFDPAEVARLGQGSYLLDAELGMACSMATGCPLMPQGIVPSNDALAARSDVPVLLLTGEGDPQNPPSNVADAPVELPNSLSLVVPGQGHTVGHLGCMPSLVTAFVEAGTTKGLDVSCVRRVPVPPPETGG
jgi:pimeloyl-ACP methyl ester carboxylesterase